MGVRFLKNINVILPPTIRVSYIILSITLTVILISSPIVAVYSPSMVLKVGFTSASATDATTDGEEEEVDDSGGDVQEEATEEQEEDQDGGVEEEEEQQLATVVGEICDDFEDNDGDGLIDLADVEDCASPPVTQGTITAPTTTPSPSVTNTNTTATNSTNNTLTASEITTREMTTPPSTDDEASGNTTGNTVTDEEGRPVYDLEKDCESYEELGIPPPPLGFGQPPDAKWYHCPPGVGVWRAPNGTTSLDTGGIQGQQQQQPNSPSSCPPEPTNYYDAPARIINVQLPPSSSPPSSQTTNNPCPPGEGTTTENPDGSITVKYPDGPSITTKKGIPGVDTIFPEGTHVRKFPDGKASVNFPYSGSSNIFIDYSPDGTFSVNYPHYTILIMPDKTVRTPTNDNTITSYRLDGSSITENSLGTVIKRGTPDDAIITSYKGALTIKYPDDLNVPSIRVEKDSPSYQEYIDYTFPDRTSIRVYKFQEKNGASAFIPLPGDATKNLFVDFHSDGTISKGSNTNIGSFNVVKPDNTAGIGNPDGTITSYSPMVP